MLCPRCKTDIMGFGIAIDHSRGHQGSTPNIAGGLSKLKAEDIKLIDVLKCHKCGHSDDGR